MQQFASFGAVLRKMERFVSFGGWFTQDRAVDIVWRLGYKKKGHWHRLGAGLHETRRFVLLGGSITRNVAVGIIWGLGYAKWAFSCRLGA